jgi:hypothetical protein
MFPPAAAGVKRLQNMSERERAAALDRPKGEVRADVTDVQELERRVEQEPLDEGRGRRSLLKPGYSYGSPERDAMKPRMKR